MQITKDDFEDWKSNPVTEKVMEVVKENLDRLAYGTMTPAYCRDSIANAIEVGKFEANKWFYNLSHEDL